MHIINMVLESVQLSFHCIISLILLCLNAIVYVVVSHVIRYSKVFNLIDDRAPGNISLHGLAMLKLAVYVRLWAKL